MAASLSHWLHGGDLPSCQIDTLRQLLDPLAAARGGHGEPAPENSWLAEPGARGDVLTSPKAESLPARKVEQLAFPCES